MRNDSGKERNRSLGALCREKSKNTNHCSAAVVDFSTKTRFLLLLAHVLGQFEGVVQVKRNRVWDSIRSGDEVGEITRLSSPHVVLVVRCGKLAPELKEPNESKDLPLGVIRDSIPESGGVSVGIGERGAIKLHGPRKLDSVCVDYVSNKCEHSNTSVLDLGMTEETDSGLISLAPEISFGEVERIIISKHRIQLLGQSFKISFCLRHGSGSTSVLGGGKGGGRTEDRGKDGELHFSSMIASLWCG
mmetsp:Transcript_28958/g.60978  ORF Transcript_28958/g.60978 Transcript_28958/m.60978 type:complete len:246 (-) Transcript_28958:74-811(-)